MDKNVTLSGDEGMWPLNLIPKDRLKKLYSFDTTDKWLTNVQRSCVRMNNGGSASFVSGDGLIATNHHVASSILHALSSEGKDYLYDGFLARTHAEELKAPQLEVNVLWEIEDVTARVEDATRPAATDAARTENRRAIIATIEKESKKVTGLRSDIVTLYNGGRYHLYRYKSYTDIRLVFAPESAIASFGGDIDNYEYLRYSLDVTFFRVYENGKPLKSPNHFTWSTKAPVMGETLFVAGHPGTTDRLTTYDRVVMMRDIILPDLMSQIYRQEIILQQFSGRSPEQERQAKDDLHSIQNIRKRYAGQLASIQTPSFTAKLFEQEKIVRTAVKKNRALAKQTGEPWNEIRDAYAFFLTFRQEYVVFEGARGFKCRYFSLARTIVRLVQEDGKPNAKRLTEYGDARRQPLLDRLYSPAPIYPDLEEIVFTDSLRYALEMLGPADKEMQSILGGKSIEAIAHEYVLRTKLGTVATRKKLVTGGIEAVRESKDPFIQLALLIDTRARKARALFETKVDSIIEDAYSRIAHARFALFGESIYPDATFTLRLAYGSIVPYHDNTVLEPNFTTIGGVFAHGVLHENIFPWKLPDSWEKKKTLLIEDHAAFNFITTHDTHGGNSGSPVITKDLAITGLLFDGIVHTQGGDSFRYMAEEKDHTVCVHSQGIYTVLKKVYRATELVKELDGN